MAKQDFKDNISNWLWQEYSRAGYPELERMGVSKGLDLAIRRAFDPDNKHRYDRFTVHLDMQNWGIPISIENDSNEWTVTWHLKQAEEVEEVSFE